MIACAQHQWRWAWVRQSPRIAILKFLSCVSKITVTDAGGKWDGHIFSKAVFQHN